MSKFIGTKQFYKRIFFIVFPIIIQNGITNFVGLLDNMMIGQLGTLAMSGVSITNQLLLVFQLSIFGAMSGPGIYMAQFYGKDDHDGIRSCFRYKYIIALLISLFAICLFFFFGEKLIAFYISATDPVTIEKTMEAGLTYLKIMLIGLIPFALTQVYSSSQRETGNTFLPMISSVIAVVLNFILNYLLIFGNCGFPKLGIVGGAIATVTARFVEMLVIVVGTHFIYHSSCVNQVYQSMKIPMQTVKAITINGLPLLVNEILWSGALAMVVQCYSTRGIEAVAAVNITSTVTNFFMIVCYAIGNGIAIVLGQHLGAGRIEDAKDDNMRLVFMNVVLCTIIGIILFIVSTYIPHIYNTSDVVKSTATSLLRISACMMPVISVYYCAYFTLRAGGKTVLTFMFDSGYSVCVSFVLAFVLTRFTNLSIFYVYLCVQGADIFKAICGLYLVQKGVWLHNIVSEL